MDSLSPQNSYSEDAVFVQRASRGDRAAFEQVVARHRRRVQAIVRLRVPEDEVDDLVQDVLVQAWEKLPNLKDPQAFASWLTKLTINTCRSRRRHAARKPVFVSPDDIDLVSSTPDPLTVVLRWEQLATLRNALLAVSVTNRRALIMRLWEQYTYSEIAERLDIPENTVAGRIHRAKNQLRQALGYPEVVRSGRAMHERENTMADRIQQPQSIPQLGHSSMVVQIAVSPDGTRFVSVDSSGVMIVWNILTGLQEQRVPNLGYASALVFSQDGSKIAVSGWDGNTVVWDVEKMAKVVTLPIHGRPVRFSATGTELLTASWSPDPETLQWVKTSVLVWDLASRRVVRRVENLTGTPRAMSQDCMRLATFTGVPTYERNVFVRLDSATMIVWDLSTGQEICRSSELPGMPGQVTFSADGTQVAASFRDEGAPNDILVWNAESGDIIHSLRGLNQSATSLAFSPNGELLSAGSGDGRIIIWDVSDARVTCSLENSGRAEAMAFAPDGRSLIVSRPNDGVTFFAGGGIAVWDIGGKAVARAFKQITHPLLHLSFSPDGGTLAACGFSRNIQMWDNRRGKIEALLPQPEGSFTFAVDFAPDGNCIVASIDCPRGEQITGEAQLWDAKARKLLQTLSEHKGIVYTVRFSADGSQMTSCSLDGSILIWDVNSGKVRLRLHYEEGWMSHKVVTFNSDGTMLASNSIKVGPHGSIEHGELSLWNTETGERFRQWTEEDMSFETMSFSPDGNTLAVGMGCPEPAGTDVRVLDIHTGQNLRELALPQQTGRVCTIAFRPDGHLLSVGTMNGYVILVDPDTTETRGAFQRHSGLISSTVFSPNGRALASAGMDGIIRIWNVEKLLSGQATRESVALIALDHGAAWLAYTPDGYYSCSPKAEDYLLWRLGSETFDRDRLATQYCRPDIVEKALQME